jgi:hypothetical protein
MQINVICWTSFIVAKTNGMKRTLSCNPSLHVHRLIDILMGTMQK